MNGTAVAISIVLVILLLILLSTYNGLVQLRHEIRLAWGSMDEQFKQRYDLIATLVPLVQSAGGDIASRLPAVIVAKNQAAVAFSPVQHAKAEAALSTAIQNLLACGSVDSTEFIDICTKLLSNQKLIDQACNRYNDRVYTLNALMSSFPYFLTAKAVGLRFQPAFELTDQA